LAAGEVSSARCWEVLGSSGVAWVAMHAADGIRDVAVGYVASGARLILQPAPGRELEGERVAFRVDGAEGDWAVVGLAELDLRDGSGGGAPTMTPVAMVGYASGVDVD
jgi:hypothetical protein